MSGKRSALDPTDGTTLASTNGSAPVDNDDDDVIGPLPSEAAPAKKAKVLQFEHVYLDALPSSDAYERSYMHKEPVAFVRVTKTEFIITASSDGHLKFWKKMERGIEFVKHFRAHLGTILFVSVNATGTFCASISDDKSMKVFDVINFDMINMIKLGFVPLCCEWIHSHGEPIFTIAVSDKASPRILIYDGRGPSEPLRVLDNIHSKTVTAMRYNHIFNTVISVDRDGILEYWHGATGDYQFPEKVVDFEFKSDTDLYEFASAKCSPTAIEVSKDGKLFATISTDKKVHVFRFLTGKLFRVFDESNSQYTGIQEKQDKKISMVERERRLAVEKELDKSDARMNANVIFDDSGNFILYATLMGVKLINLKTNKAVRTFGKCEGFRFLNLGLFQGKVRHIKAATTVEAQASDNPALDNVEADPTLFATVFKKNRFFLFTRRAPLETTTEENDRDVFNEKPSKEEAMTAIEPKGEKRISSTAVIHTTLGDIHVNLFAKECPRTVENFCVHARDGYYNGHIFHRIIKSFMIQTGDPKGDGTGGESIWGGEFEDEFHPTLRHDHPYTLSMANAGPNTNGSQFFITVVPAPWLDNKHTVFGRVTRGMEVCQKISLVKTHPKTDKPYDDIAIVNIAVK